MASSARMVVADRGDAGHRLDHVVCRHLQDLGTASRTRVQAWIRRGDVRVNGTPVRRVAARTVLGDIVTVDVPAATPRPAIAAEDLPLAVLYEDEYLIAVNKPPGIVVHPTYRHATGTVLNGLLWRAAAWPAGSRPSIVGRLDKQTSGLVIAAKSGPSHAALQRMLASAHSEKDYLAIVYGRVPEPRGTIDLHLERDRQDRRRVVAAERGGSASLTRFERLARVAAPRVGLSLLRCRLATGRMHQIRVHLAARGWPIVGDAKYGEPRWTDVADGRLASVLRAFPRQALHAHRLAFTHPHTGARIEIEAGIPADMAQLLDAAGFGPRLTAIRAPAVPSRVVRAAVRSVPATGRHR